MSMMFNKTEVMLLTKKDEYLYWGMWLDNEIETCLKNDNMLFETVSTADDFIESIGKMFEDKFDNQADINFIKQYCEDFSAMDEYWELVDLVQDNYEDSVGLKSFKKLVLVSNNEEDGYREYSWNLFDFEKSIFKKGRQKATFGEDYHFNNDDCNPKSKEYMKMLLSKE